jgi:hypothetical protein
LRRLRFAARCPIYGGTAQFIAANWAHCLTQACECHNPNQPIAEPIKSVIPDTRQSAEDKMWVTVLSLLMAVSVWLSVTSLAIQTNKNQQIVTAAISDPNSTVGSALQ